MTTSNERILNIPGLLRHIWQRKLVFLLVFAVTLGVALGYVMTQPRSHTATQVAVLTVPEVSTEAEATQQSAVLPSILTTYQALLKHPLVMEPVLQKHPDIPNVDALVDRVTITTPSPLAISIETSDVDPDTARALIQDLMGSFVANAPAALEGSPTSLHLGLNPLGEVSVAEATSGRGVLVAAGLLLSLVVAFGVTAFVPRRS
ncbi:MAG: Wzz/FepE/Etk N-terminal domain-containing protein [Propionibacteriaceae bacterium]|nr:Wzz/FepE/Etk N-terminal domain-containing protein [Propionibacteriaceae bacterium]